MIRQNKSNVAPSLPVVLEALVTQPPALPHRFECAEFVEDCFTEYAENYRSMSKQRRMKEGIGTGSVATAMTAILRDLHVRGRLLGAVLLVIVLLFPAGVSGVRAQNVDGEPITQLDIDERSKLRELMSPSHKAPSQQEVLDELTSEEEKISEAKRRGIDPSDSDVDSTIGIYAKRMGMSTDQFNQLFTKRGVTVRAFKAWLRAELVRKALGQ